MATGLTVSESDALRLAVDHHQAGRLAEADALCRQILNVQQQNFGALYLLGMMALDGGRHREAVDLIGRAVVVRPKVADARSGLGNAYLALDELDAAESAYRSAIELDPAHVHAHNGLGVILLRRHLACDAAAGFRHAIELAPEWAVPHFNLGLALRESRDFAGAVRELQTAWMLDPYMQGPARACVDTTAEWVRDGAKATFPGMCQDPIDSPAVSVVYCSIDDRKDAAAERLYRRLFAGYRHEIIAIRDAESLAEAYNRGIGASVGDIVVLSHDDVDVLASDFAPRLFHYLRRFDVIGAIGATEMTGPSWSWSRHPHLCGWITHRPQPDGEWRAAVVDPRPSAGEIRVLDGVFLAAHRAVFDEVAFDEETFDGFHLYDIDWSYRASLAGFRLGTAGDLLLVHESVGRYDEAWATYADLFCAKHGIEDLEPPPPAQLFEAMFGSADQVRTYFACLATADH
jgi:Flp pilus assembly protein TadD